MSTKTKSTLPETPKSKASPATPRISKPTRGLTKSDADSPSTLPNPRPPIEKSPRSVTSKPTVERRSPRLSTPPDKKPISRIVKPSELQAELNVVQEDLKKAKEKLVVVEKEKAKALEELKEAQRLAEEGNEKLREALVAQKRAEESSEIEKFRAVEMEQAGIEVVQKKEDEWQKELESVRNQHASDVAALLSAAEELERVKQELIITCEAKNQALTHAEDATKIAENQAEKVEKLSAELVQLKSLLDSKTEEEANENGKLVADLKQEMDSLRQELAMTSDAKTQALTHADEATKIAEIQAEKVEKLSAEVVHLKSLLDSRNEEEAHENAKLVAELKQEIDTLREELAITSDAKNDAISRVDDATKTIEIHAEKVEKLSAEANENAKLVAELKLEIETVSQELEKSKVYEIKFVEHEAAIEQLNVDLEAARVAESYAHSLMEEWKKRVEELEMQTEEAKQLERSASESLESIMKQLEDSNDHLHDAESEISSLKEKVGLLEISIKRQKGELEESEHRSEAAKEEALKMEKEVESLRSELETLKEEKVQALHHEKLAASSVQTLLEEKNKLYTELESSRDEEEKSKKAMESLASALHEVSSEAREAKEKLLSLEADRENFESELEDLKLVLKATNEKYEHMLDDAKEDVDILSNSLEQTKLEYQKLKDEWEHKELHLMNSVKESEEKNVLMEKEMSKLVNLLNEAEENANSEKEEETFLRNSLKDAESEVIYLKEVLGGAKAESMQLKESLMDKENEFQSILHENEELRAREATSLKRVEELSKLLEEARSTKQVEENGELSDSEKDYDMLPKVVEFSEQNGGGRDERHSEQSVAKKPEESNHVVYDEAVHAGPEVDKLNGKPKESESKEKEVDEPEEVDFKMWESCKIEEKDFSPEREPEQESFDDDIDSKAEAGESVDQLNELPSTESVNNGGTSPVKQQSQKKKKPLLSKFGSLLKKKSTTTPK